jgi:hypothetical protein
MIFHRRIRPDPRREIGELARQSKTPLHFADFTKYIDTPDMSHACYHMRQAMRAGVVRILPSYGVWVAIR